MNITPQNYEAFFIDYYDGNLSAEQVAELFLFLESHPGLKSEFESFSNIRLEAPAFPFPGRDQLKKGEITEANIQHYLVAALEGDLSGDESNQLNQFLERHPGYRTDVGLYAKTVSVADPSIVYPGKKRLHRAIPFYIAYKREIQYGIAAMLLLSIIAGSVRVFNRSMVTSQTQVAQQAPVTPPVQVERTAPGVKQETQPIHQPATNVERSVTVEQPMAVNREPVPANRKASQPDVRPTPESIQPSVAEPVLLAGSLPAGAIRPDDVEMQVAYQPAREKVTSPSNGDKYLTVWEALRQTSENNLRRMASEGDEVLAYANESEPNATRLVNVLGNGIEKISNDKVKVESSYDSDKQSNRFVFSVGKFKIERK